MANLKVDLSLNDGGLKKTINEDKQAVREFTQTVDNGSRSVSQTAQKFSQAVGSLTNYKKELSKLTKEVVSLEFAYAKLSDEQKRSDFGRQLAAQLNDGKEKAATFKDQIIDTNNEIKQLSSDSFKSDAVAQGFDIMSTSLGGLLAATQLCGLENEKLKNAIAAVTIAQAAANAVVKVTNMLEPQSALMLGIRRLRESELVTAITARKTAEVVATDATKKATIAQHALNVAQKAMPWALLITGIAAAAYAIYNYAKKTEDATDKTDELKKSIHESAVQGAKDAVTESTKLQLLYEKSQNVNLSKETRLQAVKDIRAEYPGYFKDLSDEEILAGKAAGAYRQLANDIIAVAQARAYQKKIEELTSKNIDYQDALDADKAWQKANKGTHEANQRNIEGQSAMRGFIPNAGVPYAGVNSEVELEWSKSTERINENTKALEENNAAIERYKGQINALSESQTRYQQNTEKVTKTLVKTPTKSKQTVDKSVDMEKYAQQAAAKAIAEFRKQIEAEKKQLATADAKNASISRTQQFSSFDKAVGNDKPNGERDLSYLQQQMNFNDRLISQLRELQKEYQKAGMFGTQSYNEIGSEIQEVTAKQAELAQKAKEFNDENKRLEDKEKATAKLTDAITQAGGAFQSLGSSYKEPVLNGAAIIANAIATMIQAYTQAAASPAVTSTGWGWLGFALTGAVQLASVISQIHSLSGYAQGGIVGGGSYVGDSQIIRVNSGEAVLTQSDQSRFLRLLDGGNVSGGANQYAQVDFKIRGAELYGVIKNYSKQQSATGHKLSI